MKSTAAGSKAYINVFIQAKGLYNMQVSDIRK